MTMINFETTILQDSYLHQKLVQLAGAGRISLKAGIKGAIISMIDEAAGLSKVFWRCEACKFDGCTENPPERCPRCNAAGKFYELR
jgi:rubrerythrin